MRLEGCASLDALTVDAVLDVEVEGRRIWRAALLGDDASSALVDSPWILLYRIVIAPIVRGGPLESFVNISWTVFQPWLTWARTQRIRRSSSSWLHEREPFEARGKEAVLAVLPELVVRTGDKAVWAPREVAAWAGEDA